MGDIGRARVVRCRCRGGKAGRDGWCRIGPSLAEGRLTGDGGFTYFTFMITFTEAAAAQVKTMREKLEDDTRCLRVLVEAGGCSGFEYGMSFDEPKADDVVVETQGLKVLIDPASAVYLEGCSVKFDDGLHGKGFEIINPNAQTTCGCGKSFS